MSMRFVIYDTETGRFAPYEMEDISQECAERFADHGSSIDGLMKALTDMRQELAADISKTYRLQNELTIRAGRMEEMLMDVDGEIAKFDVVAGELRRRIEANDRKVVGSVNDISDRVMALEIASIQRSREGYKIAGSSDVVNSENVVPTVALMKEDLTEIKSRIGDMMVSLGVDRINEVNMMLSRFESKLEAIGRIETEWASMQAWMKSEITTVNMSIATLRAQMTPIQKRLAGKKAQVEDPKVAPKK